MSRADRFEPLPDDVVERWTTNFEARSEGLYPWLLGFRVEEVRVDYARIAMPFKRELQQAGGVVHGGAIASLLDTAVVPAVGATLPEDARFSTVDQHVQYIGPLVDTDAVAEGWVVRRGRRTVFCESEVLEVGTGRLVARSLLTYHVSLPRTG